MYRQGNLFRDIPYYLLPLGGVLLLCIVKYRLLMLGNYQSDIYLLYQAANDWLIDKPLYTENSYGNLMKQHTYYLLPLFAPFTQLGGVFGLVVLQALLYLAAVFSWITAVDRPQRLKISLMLTLLLCGPLGFYVFDDPVYGWHAENLLLPLTLWAAAALYRKQRYLSWALLICMALTREDGALQAAGLLSVYTWFLQRSAALPLNKALKRIVVYYAVAVAVMLLSLFIITAFPGSRLHGLPTGWALFVQDSGTRDVYLGTLIVYFIALVLVLPLGFRLFYQGRSYDWLALVFIVPVLLSGLAGGLFYFPDAFYSVLWPPRLVYTWSLCIVFVLYLVLFQRRSMRYSIRWIWALLPVLLINAGALYLPVFYKTYNPWYFLRQAFATPDTELRQTIRELKCVSATLPARQTLLVDRNFAVYFQEHDFVLCDGLQHPPGKELSVAVLHDDTYFRQAPAFQPQDSLQSGNIRIYFDRRAHPLYNVLKTCIHN